MQNKELKRVRLGKRDYEILKGIEKWSILGLGQIEGLIFKKGEEIGERSRLFFNEVGREIYTRACYKRLADLEAGGYLKSQYYLNHPKLYTLTALGHEALVYAGLAGLPGFRRGMSEALVTHEIMANGVGLFLSQILGLNVTSEHERDWKPGRTTGEGGRLQLPDLWVADRKQEVLAIEIELTQKSELRYKEIFERYTRFIGYRGRVLYLTGWRDGLKTLWRYAKKYDKPYIHIAGLQDFRAQFGRCTFIGISSEYRLPARLDLAPEPQRHEPAVAPRLPEPPRPPVVPAEPQRPEEAPGRPVPDAAEPAQWSGYRPNPYLHLPPPLRPKEC